MTGELFGAGMNGYGNLDQTTIGMHLRQRARAFVFQDAASNARIVHVTAETGLMFQSVFEEVLRRLNARFGDLYHRGNVLLTATHTHAGPGGNSGHLVYDITVLGFRPITFEATVAGIVDSIQNAHNDIAPAIVGLSRGSLSDAGVNRSVGSFDRDPEGDRAAFPAKIDPNSITLQIARNGRVDGIINWFATHGTSMKASNRLISTDNKGYAAYRWEREAAGIDYLANDNTFVAAFAQSTPGDISANLALEPGTGPTADEFENTRIIGDRQYEAARAQSGAAKGIGAGIDVRWCYVDMSNVTVAPEFTGDGRSHKTGPAMLGAAFAAGSQEDGGGGDDLPFNEGARGGNPVVRAVTELAFNLTPELREAHAPKDILLPVGLVPGAVQQVFPFYLVRIGNVYLFALPFEVTIVSGLRMRRTIAACLGVPQDSIIVQGYTNGYGHYVTTPEEYDAQNYEGGATIFGRWELPAIQQIATQLATAMHDGTPVPPGNLTPDLTGQIPVAAAGALGVDLTPPGRGFGEVIIQPAASYTTGQQARVAFVGANPNNNLRRGDTYLTVERRDGGEWTRIADDGDWSTKLFVEQNAMVTTITVTWDIPADQSHGTYRIGYRGDARDGAGRLSPITGFTNEFSVTG